MRGFRRASLWTLTRKSSGSRETEITAFAVMPSTFSSLPLVTTVTPVGKWVIALRRASASASLTSQGYSRSFTPSGGIHTLSGWLDASTHACLLLEILQRATPRATIAPPSPCPSRTNGQDACCDGRRPLPVSPSREAGQPQRGGRLGRARSRGLLG